MYVTAKPKENVTVSSTTESAVTNSMTTTAIPSQAYDITQMVSSTSCKSVCANVSGVREAVAWTVASVSMVLFVVSLTVNITMLWLRYKKRQAKGNNVEAPMYEMEGNPCYEAASVKQTTDNTGVQEVHLYERVNQNETK